jgi:predicted transcriptional regulator
VAAERNGRRRAGELEGEVLTVLHGTDAPLTPAQVLEELGGDLAYTTVTTILARLHQKEQVRRLPAGKGFAYCPAASEAEHAARQMATLLGSGADRAAVLAQFVGELDPGDEALLQRLIAERSAPGKR